MHMARSSHPRDASQAAGDLDETSSGTGIVLMVPRDADTAILHVRGHRLHGRLRRARLIATAASASSVPISTQLHAVTRMC